MRPKANTTAATLPRVIGITGHARSGKTTAGEHLEKHYNATRFVNSSLIGDLAEKLGAAIGRASYAKIGMAVFDVFGRDVIAKHWLGLIAENDINTLFVVDGIRYPEEVLLYRRQTRFLLIGIDSDDAVRYRRSKSASDSQKDEGQTLEEFCSVKLHENESFIDGIVSQADVQLYNNFSLDQFHSSLTAAVESFLRNTHTR